MTTFAKSIWDKSEVLWRTGWGTQWELGEPIGNLMGTYRELQGYIVRTYWEPGENGEKILLLLLYVHVFFPVLLRVRTRLK
jgi:hypothetical protein